MDTTMQKCREALAMLAPDGDMSHWTDAHTLALTDAVAVFDSRSKDAERYRVIRQDHEGSALPDLALYAGRALDEYIDAAIDRMRGIGAAQRLR